MPTEISQADFRAFFKSGIRVRLNWCRLEKECWPIRLLLLGDKKKIGNLYPPWYVTSAGRQVAFDNADAEPIPFSKFPKKLESLDAKRRQSIRDLAAKFEKSVTPIWLVAPAYHLRGDRSIVLDGNHRVAALMISKVDFKLLLFVVDGPHEEDALPDLIHWRSLGTGR